MSDPKYTIKVVERKAIEVVGLSVRTSMATAADDCPTLWHRDFGPRMMEAASFPDESYGISTNVEGENFDYWAALPYRSGDPVPAGMKRLSLPGGTYAECSVNQLEDLAGAYQYVYTVWAVAEGYEFPIEMPSYEVYPVNFMETGRLMMYMPLRSKS